MTFERAVIFAKSLLYNNGLCTFYIDRTLKYEPFCNGTNSDVLIPKLDLVVSVYPQPSGWHSLHVYKHSEVRQGGCFVIVELISTRMVDEVVKKWIDEALLKKGNL